MNPVLSVQNIGACFGKNAIFHAISFEVYPGNVLALVGPRASGKSSLLRMICGLNIRQQGAVFCGQIFYEGRPMAENRMPVMVVQKAHMVLGTVYQNLTSKYAEEHAEEPPDLRAVLQKHLESLGLKALAEMLDYEVLDLSSLQRKQLMLANVLLSNPPLICLIDPVRDLTDEDALEYLSLIRSLKSRCSVLLTLENLEQVRFVADRVGLLAGGKIHDRSTVKDFFERSQSPLVQEFLQKGTCSVAPLDVTREELEAEPRFTLAEKVEELALERDAWPEISEPMEGALGAQATEPGLVTHMEPFETSGVKKTDEWVRTPTSVGGRPFRAENYEFTQLELDQQADERFIAVIDEHFALHGGSLEVESDEMDSFVELKDTASLAYGIASRGPRSFYWLRPGVLAGTPKPGLFVRAAEDLRALQRVGITHLITLTDQRLDDGLCRKYGISNIYYPIGESEVPTMESAARLCRSVADLIEQGAAIAYHCHSGMGRTGMMLVAQLIWGGTDAAAALQMARDVYRPWVQSAAQEKFLEDFQAWLVQQRHDVASGKGKLP